MPLAPGAYRAGPDTGSLLVKTFREGMVAMAGHDLVLEVARWEADVVVAPDPAQMTMALRADPRSLAVRDASGGAKPLGDRDRAQIADAIDAKVLRGLPIGFRSTAVRPDAGALLVDGELTLAGTARPLTVPVEVRSDGTVAASVPLDQSAWG